MQALTIGSLDGSITSRGRLDACDQTVGRSAGDQTGSKAETADSCGGVQLQRNVVLGTKGAAGGELRLKGSSLRMHALSAHGNVTVGEFNVSGSPHSGTGRQLET